MAEVLRPCREKNKVQVPLSDLGMQYCTLCFALIIYLNGLALGETRHYIVELVELCLQLFICA